MDADAPQGYGRLEMSTETRWGGGVNAEAIQAWDGPLFDRFVRFRHLLTTGLGVHGEAALALHPPPRGGRVIDIGCGFGDTTQRIAGLVGPEGEALGVDAAPRFIEASIADAAQHGVANARFEVADVETTTFAPSFDMGFARFGTMFFTNPVPALRNVRGALKPGATFAMVVWRRREDNDWMYRAQTTVEAIVERPAEYDEPTCGPGPFSMANADTVTDQMLAAGFHDVRLDRCDLPILVGRDVDEAIDLVMSIGPAGEILRLAGDRAAHLHGTVHDALAQALGEFATDDGLRARASTWIVSATA
jgi:ubiquinone/menaquinone biosynthesis C-methylase UbiE